VVLKEMAARRAEHALIEGSRKRSNNNVYARSHEAFFAMLRDLSSLQSSVFSFSL